MSYLRFGTFIPPIHPVGENPLLCMERDMATVQHLDALGYDEAWIGEHHSAGAELIAIAGTLHCCGGGTHQAYPAGHRCQLSTLSPPPYPRRPHHAAQLHDARVGSFSVLVRGHS